MDAITLLTNDHSKVRQMLGQLATKTPNGGDKSDLVSRIEMEVKIHSKLEEEIFYPAFKNAASSDDAKDIYFEAVEEHHVVDKVLPELKGLDTDSDEFHAKATVLKELIEHHAEEEEKEMFIKARKLMGAEKLQELGQMMETRKEELLEEWQNPITGVLKKAQSMVEKVLPTSAKHAKVEANRERVR